MQVNICPGTQSHLAGMNADIDGGPICLLPLYSLDVDPELAPVTLDDLAHLLALVVASHNLDLVIFPKEGILKIKLVIMFMDHF